MKRLFCACMMVMALGFSSPVQAQEGQVQESKASKFLEAGFAAFATNDPVNALTAFKAALNTGELSEPGRALCYWHIAECERVLGHESQMAEAFLSFAVIAQDIITEQKHYADFIDGFKVSMRLSVARAMLNIVWVNRSSDFGRSISNAILVFDSNEIEFFAAYVGPCAGAKDRYVERAIMGSNGEENKNVAIERVSVSCKSAKASGTYYLVQDKRTEEEKSHDTRKSNRRSSTIYQPAG